MKKLSLLLALVAVLAFVTIAQEDEEDLNWCTDGTWTCDYSDDPETNNLVWQCGWYFAHVEVGAFSMWDVPCWCYPFMTDTDGDWDPDFNDSTPYERYVFPGYPSDQWFEWWDRCRANVWDYHCPDCPGKG